MCYAASLTAKGIPADHIHKYGFAFERKRALALKLKCPGMEFATELIARFARSGAKIAEIPTPLRRDLRGGSSHLRTVRDGLRHLYYILFDKPFCR